MIEIPEFKKEELLDILCSLIKKKSENPLHTEEEAARYVQEILQGNGIPAELSWAAAGRPNVLARIKGNMPGPTLLYNGHLDVVPVGNDWSVDPYACVVKEGKLFGRGAADMKSGVSAMIYAAIMLKRIGNFAGELILLFNVDEERVNIGMHRFLKDDISADYAVIAEPTDLDICIAHKGVGRYRVRTAGVPGHAAYVTNPESAITKMSKLLPLLEKLGSKIKSKADPLLGPGSLTVTKINGGTAINIVPEQCEIEIDRRVLPGETRDFVLAEIKETFDDSEENEDYEIENYLFIAASFINKEHPLVQILAKASKDVRGFDAKIKIFEATCEAPFLSVDKGIPTLIFGPGSLRQAHVKDEFVEIEQVVTASQIFIELALRLLQK